MPISQGMTPLSVLDLSPVPEGKTAGQSLENTRDLARHAEALGYRPRGVHRTEAAGPLYYHEQIASEWEQLRTWAAPPIFSGKSSVESPPISVSASSRSGSPSR